MHDCMYVRVFRIYVFFCYKGLQRYDNFLTFANILLFFLQIYAVFKFLHSYMAKTRGCILADTPSTVSILKD